MNLIQKKPRVKRDVKLQAHVSLKTYQQLVEKVGDGSVSGYLRNLIKQDLSASPAEQPTALAA